MMSRRLITAVRLLRPQSVILMCLFLAIPIGICSNSIVFAIVQIIPFFFLLCGEIALNDVCDIEKDRINKPQRPLVSGELSVCAALILALSVILASVVLSVVIFYNNIWRIVIFVGLLFLLSLYNIPGKLMPLIKTIITASATVLALSFLLTFDSLEHPVPSLCCAFSFILGRELLMDIRDYDGDLMNGYKTLAIKFGKQTTFLAASFCFSIAIVFCTLLLISDYSLMRLMGMILFSFTTIILVVIFSRTEEVKQQNQIALLLWLPILEMLLFII